MKNFTTRVEGHEGEFTFECHENIEPIDIGDKYIFFFGGIADVQVCDSEAVKYEINPNDRVKDWTKIDLVTGFWKNCYKIKTTNFDLSLVF